MLTTWRKTDWKSVYCWQHVEKGSKSAARTYAHFIAIIVALLHTFNIKHTHSIAELLWSAPQSVQFYILGTTETLEHTHTHTQQAGNATLHRRSRTQLWTLTDRIPWQRSLLHCNCVTWRLITSLQICVDHHSHITCIALALFSAGTRKKAFMLLANTGCTCTVSARVPEMLESTQVRAKVACLHSHISHTTAAGVTSNQTGPTLGSQG